MNDPTEQAAGGSSYASHIQRMIVASSTNNNRDVVIDADDISAIETSDDDSHAVAQASLSGFHNLNDYLAADGDSARDTGTGADRYGVPVPPHQREERDLNMTINSHVTSRDRYVLPQDEEVASTPVTKREKQRKSVSKATGGVADGSVNEATSVATAGGTRAGMRERRYRERADASGVVLIENLPHEVVHDDDEIADDDDSSYRLLPFLRRPHSKYLLVASFVAVVACALGLVAAGLGMAGYFSNGDGENVSTLPEGLNEGTEENEIEGLVFVEPGDGDELDDTGPKAPALIDEETSVELFNLTDATNSTPDATTATSTTIPPPSQVYTPAELHSFTLRPIADTFLEYNKSRAYGDKNRLKVDGDPSRQSLLTFNLTQFVEEASAVHNTTVSVADNAVGASLRLYPITSSTYGGKVSLLRNGCAHRWNEHDVSWTNAPSCIFRNNSDDVIAEFNRNISAYNWTEADVETDFENLPEVITLKITSDNSDGVTYASRETNVTSPQLVVYYTLDDPEAIAEVDEEEEEEEEEGIGQIVRPTNGPTVSIMPTMEKVPTGSPTGGPTVSIMPTKYPTTGPTFNPTVSFSF